MKSRRVAFKIRGTDLQLAPSAHGLTLPFETVAKLDHIRRGKWVSLSLWDEKVIASGISQRDVIRATIEAVWQ